jgi:hypothetical protein
MWGNIALCSITQAELRSITQTELCSITQTELRSIAPKHCDLFIHQIQTLCVIVCSEFQL